ncbi:MAG: hypothetical protein IPN53_17510 [Comamonadaceae bacterium]|nr:hypothetical protein [Comamonadaceae bacterium]
MLWDLAGRSPDFSGQQLHQRGMVLASGLHGAGRSYRAIPASGIYGQIPQLPGLSKLGHTLPA